VADSLESRDGNEPDRRGEKLPPPITEGIPREARRVALLAALLILPTAVAGFTLGGVPRCAGVVAGGSVAVVNFWLLARIVVKTTAGPEGGVGAVMGRLAVKFGLLAGSLALLVAGLRLDAVGVLLGLSVVFAGVILSQVVEWLT
jgi:hypothetical protein